MKIKHWWKRHGSTVCTVIAALGVPLSMWLTHRADMKVAEEVTNELVEQMMTGKEPEKPKGMWKHYIPAVVSGLGTVAAIIGGHSIDQGVILALAGALRSSNKQLTDFKQEVKEVAGEDVYNEVTENLVKDQHHSLSEEDVVEMTTMLNGYGDNLLKNVEDANDAEEVFLWTPTDRLFRSSRLAVSVAEYEINRLIALDGYATLDQWFGFLGLSAEKSADSTLGWDISSVAEDYGCYWVDFDHREVTLNDGTTVMAITPCISPEFLVDI